MPTETLPTETLPTEEVYQVDNHPTLESVAVDSEAAVPQGLDADGMPVAHFEQSRLPLRHAPTGSPPPSPPQVNPSSSYEPPPMCNLPAPRSV